MHTSSSLKPVQYFFINSRFKALITNHRDRCYTHFRMQTIITDSIEVASEFIRAGEIVAFPTETVYGLGADVFNESAIRKIFQAKGRPTDNPLIAHIGDVKNVERLASRITPSAQAFIDHFFPGPLTLVLPKKTEVPSIATAGLETIGIRMPRHPLALSFIKSCRTSLVAPSANLSGKPSPTTWETVNHDLQGRIACILKGEQTEVGLESTVVDCTEEIPQVLRAGAVTLEDLQRIIPETIFRISNRNEPIRSPGLKYRHYSPQAEVKILSDANESLSTGGAFIGLHFPVHSLFEKIKVCDSINEYAHSLFLFFRECDEAGLNLIYCEPVEETGLGLALMDRIKRAAHK